MYPLQKNNITPFFLILGGIQIFKVRYDSEQSLQLLHSSSLLDLPTVDVLTKVAGEDGVLGDRIISSLSTAQGLYLSISVLDTLCWPQRSVSSHRPLVIFIFIQIPEWKKKISLYCCQAQSLLQLSWTELASISN